MKLSIVETQDQLYIDPFGSLDIIPGYIRIYIVLLKNFIVKSKLLTYKLLFITLEFRLLTTIIVLITI